MVTPLVEVIKIVPEKCGQMWPFVGRCGQNVVKSNLLFCRIAAKTLHFSGRTVVVPLNAIALEIVEKYKNCLGDSLLPFISEQNLTQSPGKR